MGGRKGCVVGGESCAGRWGRFPIFVWMARVGTVWRALAHVGGFVLRRRAGAGLVLALSPAVSRTRLGRIREPRLWARAGEGVAFSVVHSASLLRAMLRAARGW